MKLLAVLLIAIQLVYCYDEKYDKVDIDKIIGDEKMYTSYIDCMLDKAPCDLEYSADFKNLFPEVIATCCAKCTPIQKSHVRKLVRTLSERKPKEFEELRKKYDPNGQYEKDFTAFILGSD